jgi:hypothetical protein
LYVRRLNTETLPGIAFAQQRGPSPVLRLAKAAQGVKMIESGRVWSDLPELDRADDPQGGAVAWALLSVGTVFAAGMLLAATWVIGVW